MTIKEFSSSISTIISLALVLFVVGLLILLPLLVNNKINQEKENYKLLITSWEDPSFLSTEQEKHRLKTFLINSSFFKEIKFHHKDSAAKEAERDGDEIFSVFGESIFPHAFLGKIKSEFITDKGLKEVENYISKYKTNPNENSLDLSYQKARIIKENSYIGEVRLFLIPFCIIFLIISFALINNTIRLSVYSKRMLIRTKRLVGATNAFIRKPYLISSIYQGVIGAIISILMLIWVFELTIKNQFQGFIHSNDFLNIGIIFGILIILGILISLVSTFFAIRRYLNLSETELYN